MYIPLGFPHRQSRCLQIKMVLLLFQPQRILFLILASLHWIEPPAQSGLRWWKWTCCLFLV